MKSLKEIESVGWGFYLICVLALLPPGIILAWQFTYDITQAITRVGIGLIAALFFAGIIAWVVNAILHQRNLRRYKEEQKVAKKEKKKKKKKR
jgi:uncharacterized membrane protein